MPSAPQAVTACRSADSHVRREFRSIAAANTALDSQLGADKAVRPPMRSNRRNIFATIRNKRQWHTPPDPNAAKWDRYVRDEAHYRKVTHYIEWNPVKAGLVKTPDQWPFSSARFRDDNNRLNPPLNPLTA